MMENDGINEREIFMIIQILILLGILTINVLTMAITAAIFEELKKE